MDKSSYRIKLIDYFKKNLKKGYPVDTLRVALINQGYSRPTIDEAARQAINEMAAKAPVLKEKPKIEHKIIIDDNPIVVKKSFSKKIIDWFFG